MDLRAAIDLAREPAFQLGALTVRPATRELIGADGAREVIEPRVMQVLVALAKAGDEILTRDDLTASCWEGRIVGEDAINRVISRLRRSAEGIGQGAFRVETITKVGYRLVKGQPVATASPPPAEPLVTPAPLETPAPVVQEPLETPAAAPAPSAGRRRLLIGGGVAGLAVAGGAAAWLWGRKPPALPADVQSLYDQGWVALGHSSPEQNSAAVGLFSQVTERAPDYADGWGALAYAYGQSGLTGPRELADGLYARARSTAKRALKLDHDNALGQAVIIGLNTRTMGRWLQAEQAYRAALARHPKAAVFWDNLSGLMFSVGRVSEAVDAGDKVFALTGTPSPQIYYRHITCCMSALRLEQADRLSAQALELYPRHFGVWFTTFYLYLYTGRADRAVAFGENVAGRPTGIPTYNFNLIMEAAKAVRTREKADIDRALEVNLAAARTGAGYAENAMLFASFLGRLDVAFQIAEAYFFHRGFDPGRRSFSNEQANFYPGPRTHVLFQLGAAAMRADPRFDSLVYEIGLKRYWAESKTLPDYLRNPA